MVIQANVGNMRDRIEIQAGTLTRGDAGSEKYTWSTVARVYGEIREDAGEKFTVTIRYYPGLTPTGRRVEDSDGNQLTVNRLKHGSRILNIEDVLDLRVQRRLMRLNCVRDDQVFVSGA